MLAASDIKKKPSSLWRVCKDVFPFGTPYYSGTDGDTNGDTGTWTYTLTVSNMSGVTPQDVQLTPGQEVLEHRPVIAPRLWPATRTTPAVGVSSPARMLIRVDLALPAARRSARSGPLGDRQIQPLKGLYLGAFPE